MYCLSCQNNLNVFAQGLLDGLCPAIFHTPQTLPRLVIKACIRESAGMDGGERFVYFPVCRQNPDAIIRGVWLRHHSCPSARPTPPLLDAYTHVHKLFTSFSGPSHPTLVCFPEFIREPAFRCDKLLIMHLSNRDKTCLYWKKTEASLMSSPVGREDVRSL